MGYMLGLEDFGASANKRWGGAMKRLRDASDPMTSEDTMLVDTCGAPTTERTRLYLNGNDNCTILNHQIVLITAPKAVVLPMEAVIGSPLGHMLQAHGTPVTPD